MLSGQHAKVAEVSSETTPQTARQRRNLLVLGLAGGLGILTLLIAVATLLLTGTASAGQARVAAKLPKDAVKQEKIGSSCVDTQYKDQGRDHTQNINEKIKYNSFPPTSGKHYYDPARWGNYPSPINQIQGVHNLEHGGIVVQYGDQVKGGDLDKLFAWYDKDANGVLMAPLGRLGHRVAATAWTHLLVCQKVDTKALDTFKKKYRYKGPEAIPKEGLEPGQ